MEEILSETGYLIRQKKSIIIEKELDKLVVHGQLTPQAVVNSAREAGSPLHKYFEWDNGIAAEKFRIGQAYLMISTTKFVCMLGNVRATPPEVTKHKLRKFLPRHDQASGFTTRVEVLNDSETRKAVVEGKVQSLRSWCASVVDIEELKDIREGVLKLIGE